MNTLFSKKSAAISLVAAFAFSGCDTPGQGAKHGAIIGAAIGALSEHDIRGAAAGAAIGAAAGALTGKIKQERRRERYYEEYPEDRYYNDPEYRGYPYARLTDEPGLVRSPYRPHHLIDVQGVPRGAQVIDPSCNRVFINP